MIRRGKKEDSLDLAALSIQVWLHTYAKDGLRRGISSYPLDTFTEQYFNEMSQNQDYCLLVCIENNHLIGFIAANLKSYWQDRANGYEIEIFYIQEYFQRRGFGRCLLTALVDRCGTPFWLSTWIYNENAIKFYRRMGFVDGGHKYFYLAGEAHKNLVLIQRH